MTTNSLNYKTYAEGFKEYLNAPKDNLRAKLIEAVCHHEGWEESALALVDDAIMPVIRQHKAEQPEDVVVILKELIRLKEYKDTHGKDLHYTASQKGAWLAAKAAITAMGGMPLPVRMRLRCKMDRAK